jgi:hypothetical protein
MEAAKAQNWAVEPQENKNYMKEEEMIRSCSTDGREIYSEKTDTDGEVVSWIY